MSLCTKKESRLDLVVFYICLIDVLFIPYAHFVSISYSLFVVVPWFLLRIRNLCALREMWMVMLFSFVVIGSTVISFFAHSECISRNISMMVQMIQIMLYYLLFRFTLEQHALPLKKVLFIFYAFVLVLAVVYNLDIQLYAKIARFWNMRGITAFQEVYPQLEGYYRYSFVWIDPNNIAYMSTSLVVFLLTNVKTNLVERLVLLVGLILILISTMSSGGILSLAIMIAVWFFLSFVRVLKTKRIRINPTYLIICLMATIPILIIAKDYLHTDIVASAMYRFTNSSLDSRTTIWWDILRNTNFLKHIFWGYGGVSFVNGKEIRPHNGHLWMILGFGIIAYILFMYIVFRKRSITPWKQYIWIVPAFLGFTVNVMITEVKLSALLMLLVVCCSSRVMLEREGILYGEASH